MRIVVFFLMGNMKNMGGMGVFWVSFWGLFFIVLGFWALRLFLLWYVLIWFWCILVFRVGCVFWKNGKVAVDLKGSFGSTVLAFSARENRRSDRRKRTPRREQRNQKRFLFKELCFVLCASSHGYIYSQQKISTVSKKYLQSAKNRHPKKSLSTTHPIQTEASWKMPKKINVFFFFFWGGEPSPKTGNKPNSSLTVFLFFFSPPDRNGVCCLGSDVWLSTAPCDGDRGVWCARQHFGRRGDPDEVHRIPHAAGGSVSTSTGSGPQVGGMGMNLRHS